MDPCIVLLIADVLFNDFFNKIQRFAVLFRSHSVGLKNKSKINEGANVKNKVYGYYCVKKIIDRFGLNLEFKRLWKTSKL